MEWWRSRALRTHLCSWVASISGYRWMLSQHSFTQITKPKCSNINIIETRSIAHGLGPHEWKWMNWIEKWWSKTIVRKSNNNPRSLMIDWKTFSKLTVYFFFFSHLRRYCITRLSFWFFFCRYSYIYSLAQCGRGHTRQDTIVKSTSANMSQPGPDGPTRLYTTIHLINNQIIINFTWNE